MNTYTKNLLLFQQLIEPKLRYRALRLARGCDFTAAELLAGAADLFAARHLGGDYTEAQLVRFGGWQLLQHCRQIGLLRRKDSQAEPVCLVPLQDADQYLAADRVDQQHRDTRLALLERALAHKSWVEPALAAAIEQIWEGATIAETAQALGLTASGLHKKLRRLGGQLLAGERPVQRQGKGSQRREAADQLDLFCVGGGGCDMADKWFAILTPAQDLDSAHWLAIERVQPGGPEAVILGLRVRQMAVRAGAGGLLALPDGSPMSLQQITLALGYTLERVQHGLNLLHSFGLAKSGEDGSIWSCDPVVLEHFAREASIQKRLPAPARGPGRPPKEGALTNAERQKKFKNKNKKVTESNEKGNENSGKISVTTDEQQPEIIDDISGNENSLIKEVNEVNTSSYTNTRDDDDDEEIDISPALVDVPAPQLVKVGEAVRKALVIGHPLHVAHQAIDAARREASPGRPWIGLALFKLGELAKPESLPPQKPVKPNNPAEVLAEPVATPDPDPERDEAFAEVMANPNSALYHAMYAMSKMPKSDDGPGKILFELCMKDAFDALKQQPAPQ